MDAKVIWKQGMSFSGTAATGFEVPIGADPEVGGANDGFRSLELMGISLAACTGMDVISILKKKQQNITAFEVRAHADRAEEHPKVFTFLIVTFLVTGHHVDEKAVVRSIELSATKYCPAQAMLSKSVPIELKYEIYEEEGGKTRLVKTGNYLPPSQTVNVANVS
jgi:putative redox protein